MRIRTLLLAIISFIVFNQLISFFVLHSFNVIKLDGYFPPATKIYVETGNGIHPISNQNFIRSGVLNVSGNQQLKINLDNRTVGSFRLRFENFNDDGNGQIDLNSIELFSHFSKHVISWPKEQIGIAFNVSSSKKKTTQTLTLNQPLQPRNIFLSFVIPLFLSICLTLMVRRFQWREFPAIQDLLSYQTIRNANTYLPLDGFRGLAAILVLLHHSGPTFKGAGGLGVWMFFVLSGFLLTKPFVTNPASSIQLSNLASFMERRFKRIIPMFFFMVTCTFLLQGHYETALRHYLFVQGDGHYWTILQEMYFYLLLPILAVGVYALCRGRAMVAMIILLVSAMLWHHFGTNEKFSIYGLNQPLRAYFDVFIVGMIGAYVYHGIYQKSDIIKTSLNNVHQSFGLIGIVLMMTFLYVNLPGNTLFGWVFKVYHSPLLSGIVCMLLILLAVVGNPQCWYKRLLSNHALRYVGIIGYSFYLVHPYCVFMTRHIFEHFLGLNPNNIAEVWHVVVISILTLAFASFTYSFIERPFLKRTQ